MLLFAFLAKAVKLAELALKLKPLIAERAKEQIKKHGGTAPGRKATPSLKSKKVSVHTDKELSKLAGVGQSRIRQDRILVILLILVFLLNPDGLGADSPPTPPRFPAASSRGGIGGSYFAYRDKK